MKRKGLFCTRNAILFFVFFLLTNFIINGKPFGLAKLMEITGGHSILDMELMGYSVDRAYEILDHLGAEGRSFHVKYIMPMDIIFPLSYGLFYFTTLTLIVKELWKKVKRPWLIGFIGLAAMLFDWLENIMIFILLNNYPNRLDGIVRIANRFTQVKSFFIIISMTLIASGLIALAFKTFAVKRKADSV